MPVRILAVADKYLLDQLKMECETQLITRMSTEGCLELLLIAADKHHPAFHLKKFAVEFFRRLSGETSIMAISSTRSLTDHTFCWAHSATAAVELAYCKKYLYTYIDLSEQQLVNCSCDNRCSGGWEHEAWQYLASNGRQTDESSYPYTATVGNNGSLHKTSLHYDDCLGRRRTDPFRYMQLPNTFFNYKSGVFNDVNCVSSNNARA
uniref:Peptidase C1A papain C-terminal domain-containing protein n=1 Tax=Daphnia galeata TaxID=27404 RepID=A0A8J2RLT7_9CRUS|nr:unnamed protein product [Daphnia galeata]